MTLREIWGRLFRANYTRALERDVARLRLENRALLNSILGIAGVPPIAVQADDRSGEVALGVNMEKTAVGGSSLTHAERGTGKPVRLQNPPSGSLSRAGKRVPGGTGMKSVATPLRRRSWHQIYRMLEVDAARKKEAV
jgi:hypothetical protein